MQPGSGPVPNAMYGQGMYSNMIPENQGMMNMPMNMPMQPSMGYGPNMGNMGPMYPVGAQIQPPAYPSMGSIMPMDNNYQNGMMIPIPMTLLSVAAQAASILRIK